MSIPFWTMNAWNAMASFGPDRTAPAISRAGETSRCSIFPHAVTSPCYCFHKKRHDLTKVMKINLGVTERWFRYLTSLTSYGGPEKTLPCYQGANIKTLEMFFKSRAAWKAASESGLSESPCCNCCHWRRCNLRVVWIDHPLPLCQLNISKLKRLYLVCDGRVD